jgi:hypothetical protein
MIRSSMGSKSVSRRFDSVPGHPSFQPLTRDSRIGDTATAANNATNDFLNEG